VARYKVVFLGLALASPEEEIRLLKGLQKKFNLTPEKAEGLLQRVPIVVKKGASREETEKYVRAFDEIGGKVRVEEEPFETLEISPEPLREEGPGRTPKRATMSCPQCGFEQVEADQCARCGVVMAKRPQERETPRVYEERVRETSSGAKAVRWEEGDGFVGAFFGTTRDLLFSPTRFYRKAAGGAGYWSPFVYAMISGIIGFGGSILWQWFFFSQWFPVQRIPALPSGLYFVVLTILLPVMAAFLLLVGSGVAHLGAVIFGGHSRGFKATFCAISYAFGGILFGIIPLIGGTIGMIYSLVLVIIGMREAHRISTVRAVLAVLPIIIVTALFIFAPILTVLFIGKLRVLFGMGV